MKASLCLFNFLLQDFCKVYIKKKMLKYAKINTYLISFVVFTLASFCTV